MTAQYLPQNPILYPQFAAAISTADPEVVEYYAEILMISEWLQNAALRAIMDGADGASVQIQTLAHEIGENAVLETAELAAYCAGFYPNPRQTPVNIWSTTTSGSAPELQVPANLLKKQYASAALVHTGAFAPN